MRLHKLFTSILLHQKGRNKVKKKTEYNSSEEGPSKLKYITNNEAGESFNKLHIFQEYMTKAFEIPLREEHEN